MNSFLQPVFIEKLLLSLLRDTVVRGGMQWLGFQKWRASFKMKETENR